jgi:O-antigen/teichoic acid export membrane protein
MTTERLSSTGRKLLSGSVLRMANLFIAALTSFFLMPFIVRHLGDRIYGFWTLAFAFIGYYGVLDFGLSSAVTQYISIAIGHNDPDECRAVFNTALRVQLLLGGAVLLATGATAVAAPWFTHNPADAALFWRVIAVLGVNLALGFPLRAYGGVLEAQLRFDIQAGLNIATIVLRTALTVWAILQGGQLLSLAWITLVTSMLMTGCMVWFARREVQWARIDRSSLTPTRAKRLFSYSIYTFAGILGDMLRFQVDAVVIAGFIGLAAVTHYRVASQFSAYYINVVASAVGMIQPVMGRLHGARDKSGLEKVFFFATRVSLCFSIFIGVSLITWGKPLIARWMGVKYEDAYWPLVVLSIAVLLDVGQAPSISLLYATFKHRFYTYMNCAEGLINLVFSLLLVRPLGVLGVALGTLIGAVVIRVVVQPLWVCKVSGLHYGNYLKFIGGTVARCGVLIAVVIAAASWGLKPSYPWMISSAVCATGVYGVGSWFFVFNRREREQLQSLVSNRIQKQTELAPLEVGVH